MGREKEGRRSGGEARQLLLSKNVDKGRPSGCSFLHFGFFALRRRIAAPEAPRFAKPWQQGPRPIRRASSGRSGGEKPSSPGKQTRATALFPSKVSPFKKKKKRPNLDHRLERQAGQGRRPGRAQPAEGLELGGAGRVAGLGLEVHLIRRFWRFSRGRRGKGKERVAGERGVRETERDRERERRKKKKPWLRLFSNRSPRASPALLVPFKLLNSHDLSIGGSLKETQRRTKESRARGGVAKRLSSATNCSLAAGTGQRRKTTSMQAERRGHGEMRSLNPLQRPLLLVNSEQRNFPRRLIRNLGPSTRQRAARAGDEKTLEAQIWEEQARLSLTSILLSLLSSKIKTTSAFPQLKWPAPPSSPSLASASRSSPPARTPCPVRNLRMSSGMATAEILHDLTSQALPLSLSLPLFLLPFCSTPPTLHSIKFTNSRARALPPREGRW